MPKIKMPTFCAECGKDIRNADRVIRAWYPARWLCTECGDKLPDKPKNKELRGGL